MKVKTSNINTSDFEDDLDIKYLIIRTKNFTVFIDHELDLDWKTTVEYDENYNGDICRHNNIMNKVASLECIPNDHLMLKIRLNYKRMLGEGLARSMKHDYDNAEIILNDAQNYIKSRNVEIARLWQLSTSCVVGIICGLLGILIWIFRSSLLPYFSDTGLFLILSALSGGLGALVSIIFRIGNIQISTDPSYKLHILEASSRIIGGIIFGLIAALFVKMGVLVPVFQKTSQINIAMFAAGLIAGASERWIPSLIAKFEPNGKLSNQLGGKQ